MPPRLRGGADQWHPSSPARMLDRLGDARPVRATAPALTALADGALLASEHATVLGPDVDAWLDTLRAAP